MGRTVYKKETVDFTTGEVVSTETIRTHKIEYHYSQFNDEIASELLNLTGLEIKALMLFEILADPKTNEPFMSKRNRDIFMSNLNVSKGTYYEIRYRLKRKGMLLDHNGAVIVNPEFFWRGNALDREKLLTEIRDNRLKDNRRTEWKELQEMYNKV